MGEGPDRIHLSGKPGWRETVTTYTMHMKTVNLVIATNLVTHNRDYTPHQNK